jgi:drug/metabolite transporter (DMT)-like permease
MVEQNIWLGMLFGVIGTVLLHLAKAMERQGIEIFAQIKARLTNTESRVEGGAKKPVIYMVGFILNQTIMFWMMLGTMFAPPTYYTSVFGLGLVALMIYSAKVLKEEIKRIEYIGSIVLIAGTLILGYDGVRQGSLEMSTINVTLALTIILTFFAIGWIIVLIVKRKGTPNLIGVVFGIFAGGSGCFDPVLKGIGQTQGSTGFLPSTGLGWIVFLISFAFAATSFWVTQWGFARNAKASVLVPCYNTLYLINPILVLTFTLPGFLFSGITVIGIVTTSIGIILMQAFKNEKKPSVGHGI